MNSAYNDPIEIIIIIAALHNIYIYIYSEYTSICVYKLCIQVFVFWATMDKICYGICKHVIYKYSCVCLFLGVWNAWLWHVTSAPFLWHSSIVSPSFLQYSRSTTPPFWYHSIITYVLILSTECHLGANYAQSPEIIISNSTNQGFLFVF